MTTDWESIAGSIDARDVINVAISGGRMLCEDAKRKWTDPLYYGMDHETRYAHYLRWCEIERRLGELRESLNAITKGGQK